MYDDNVKEYKDSVNKLIDDCEECVRTSRLTVQVMNMAIWIKNHDHKINGKYLKRRLIFFFCERFNYNANKCRQKLFRESLQWHIYSMWVGIDYVKFPSYHHTIRRMNRKDSLCIMVSVTCLDTTMTQNPIQKNTDFKTLFHFKSVKNMKYVILFLIYKG